MKMKVNKNNPQIPFSGRCSNRSRFLNGGSNFRRRSNADKTRKDNSSSRLESCTNRCSEQPNER
jgi:hypothetical protein